jgi:Ca2+-binding RTX toxin-like protein
VGIRVSSGGSGDDVIAGTAGDDLLRGFAGNDSLDGGAGNDTLEGGDGNDTLLGGRDADTLDGGAGNDTYVVTTDLDADDTTIDSGGVDLVIVDGTWTLSAGFENLQVGRLDQLSEVEVTGNALDNVMTRLGGASGNVIFDGGDGNDTLIGSDASGDVFEFGAGSGALGNDWVDGRDGVDSVSFLDSFRNGSSQARSAVKIDLQAGSLTGGGTGGSGSATLLNIENAYGGAFDDLLVAHDGHMVTTDGIAQLAGARLNGGSGNDTMIAGAAGDVFEGQHGADTYVFRHAPGPADAISDFSSGADKILLDATAFAGLGSSGNFVANDPRYYAAGGATAAHDADDRVVFNPTTGWLYYDADGVGGAVARQFILFASVPMLNATDFAVDNGSDPSGSVINGTSGADTLADTAGNDTINGLAGNDTINGGSGGTDVVNGGDGRDSLQFMTATGAVVVDFVAGHAGTTTFTSIEKVVSGDFNDRLTGDAAAQNLTSRAGSDTLAGAGGVDTLWGGAGNDTFVFRETGTANADTIGDWTSGSDEIELDNAAMAALGADGDFLAGDARFWASSTGTAHDANDRVIYNTSTRSVYYDADGTGSGAAQLVATLQAGATIAATDISII